MAIKKRWLIIFLAISSLWAANIFAASDNGVVIVGNKKDVRIGEAVSDGRATIVSNDSGRTKKSLAKENSYETVIGKNPDIERGITVEKGDVTIVGRSPSFVSLSERPATVILKLDIAQSKQVVGKDITKFFKTVKNVKAAEWDEKNMSINLLVDSQEVPAEDIGKDAAELLDKKFRLKPIEVRVRR